MLNAIFVAWALLLVSTALATDFSDGKATLNAPSLDITNFYSFRSDKDANNFVFAFNVNAHKPGKVAQADLFDDTAKYTIFIDTNGDDTAELEINVFFKSANTQYAVFVGKDVMVGNLGEVSQTGNMKAFAGYRNDPAFLDYEGIANFFSTFCTKDGGYSAKGLRCKDTGKPDNYFGNFNVGSVVVEIPIKTITGKDDPKLGTIRTWVRSFKRSGQVE